MASDNSETTKAKTVRKSPAKFAGKVTWWIGDFELRSCDDPRKVWIERNGTGGEFEAGELYKAIADVYKTRMKDFRRKNDR